MGLLHRLDVINSVILCTGEEFGLSSAEIGGIIGGLLFLVVAITLSIVGIMCNRRKDRQKRETKYGRSTLH